MELSITQVPIWLSAVFICCFLTFPILLINRSVKLAYFDGNISKSSNITKKIAVFYLCYFLLTGLISLSGFFMKNVLPPRIILFTTIPLFLFYILYVQRTQWFQIVFQHIKIEHLVSIHLFRFVGIFFFLTYDYDAIPKTFAYIGGTGDILTAVLAIPLIIALKKKIKSANILTWIWNIIGLVDIFSVLTCAIVITRMSIENNTNGVQQFGTFPFSWIPAFAPATIIFVHILIFKKLKEYNQK